jgi:hypothetical protein
MNVSSPSKIYICRSLWPHGLRRRSADARLVWDSGYEYKTGAWLFVCCECCVLSGRGLCNELITRPEEFYRLWCVVVCDLETSRMRRPWPALGCSTTKKKNIYIYIKLHLEHSFIRCWNLDASGSRSETSGKFWNVVLQKDGKDQLDWSCEKWRCIT